MLSRPAGRHVLASVALAWLVPAVSAQAQVVFTATKTDTLQIDVNGNGLADPGDTLRYTIFIEGTGVDNGTNAFLDDTPDANTALVVGSVTTTQGTVTSGNTAGDTAVQVSIGTLAGSGRSLTITFDVTVDDPLPPGVTQVSNQGTVSGSNFPSQVTDDPGTATPNDPTITPVIAGPPQVVFTATKTDALQVDVNGNGLADPGDTLRYTIFIQGTGADDGTNAFLDDAPDPNTALVVGSVTTTQGTVTSGNTAGDTTVQVSIGTLGGGGQSLTITFDVTIDDPLPPGVTQVSNQGTVSGSNFPSQVTDDPGTATPNDPTITPVAPSVPAAPAAALVLAALVLISLGVWRLRQA